MGGCVYLESFLLVLASQWFFEFLIWRNSKIPKGQTEIVKSRTDKTMKLCHMESTVLLQVFLKDVLNVSRSSFILYISAFFHRYIFLLTGLGFKGLHAISSKTMSWSLFPIDGNGLHLNLNDGWEISIKSKVFSLRVGKSTICSKPLSATVSKKAWLVLVGYCLCVMVCSCQFISGRLKSPPIKKMFFDVLIWWYLFPL